MKRMKSREVRDNWSATLRYVGDGGTVIVEQYTRPVARIVPVDEPTMTAPTITLPLPCMTIPETAEWEALPADQRRQAARDAAAAYDTIAATARRLGRYCIAVAEAIAEQDVTGGTSPEAATALAAWPYGVPDDDGERLRVMRLLADMATGMRDGANDADRQADMWRSRARGLLGEAGAL